MRRTPCSGSPEPTRRGARRRSTTPYAGLLGAYTITDLSLTDTQYETMQNTGIAWGHFIMTLQPKAGGAPTIMGGRFSSVAKMIDGQWRYVVDHASAEPPPVPASAK